VKPPLRVIVADDERPARRFLGGLLKSCDGVELAGEAATGEDAIALIQSVRPDLALLDLQMPDGSGLDVVRRLSADHLPLVAFVTAFDDFAVEAFELNAIDYLLKPIELERLQATIDRARGRLARRESVEDRAAKLANAAALYEQTSRRAFIERIPVRRRNEVLILPVRQIASIVSEGELLHLTTITKERYTITFRLHLLESRLDPRRFIRLSRGSLVNIDTITKIGPMPGGAYLATLSNGEELQVSRIQSRVLRDTLLKL
jgi:two-component system LytT family response regulator